MQDTADFAAHPTAWCCHLANSFALSLSHWQSILIVAIILLNFCNEQRWLQSCNNKNTSMNCRWWELLRVVKNGVTSSYISAGEIASTS